ncbi:hypothetical protein [Saccharomonospora saliphila]|uniref:hypothetical protein n=1 Tax=Saccharomonospora saliphila TaxID=369829 RepID=UPI00048DAC7B|nr:hypothetical protein [Saccharomonospora saliphila]
MPRMVRVARIQLVNSLAVLGLPVVILLGVLLGNILIFGGMRAAEADEPVVSGALSSIYIVMLVVHLQTMTQMFPFAVSLSVTRRDFFGATTLIVLGQSVAYGLLLTLLAPIEEATGGWGVNMSMINVPFLAHDNVLAQFLAFTAPFLLTSFLGIWFGIVFKRWGQLGVWVLGLGCAALVVGFVSLVSWQRWWPAVGEFLAGHPALALQAAYPALIAVVLAGAGYLTARRAVP